MVRLYVSTHCPFPIPGCLICPVNLIFDRLLDTALTLTSIVVFYIILEANFESKNVQKTGLLTGIKIVRSRP